MTRTAISYYRIHMCAVFKRRCATPR